jgi:uncharacterized protein YuzE
MIVRYFPETDSLYISLSERPSSESQEIAPDIVLDLDGEGRPVGIDIQHASKTIDLTRLEARSLPLRDTVLAAAASGDAA